EFVDGRNCRVPDSDMPREFRLAAYATAALSSDLRREVLKPLLTDLGLPADDCIRALQKAEILIPRGPGRYSWPHALLQEHLSAQLAALPDRNRIYRGAAEALKRHPLAATRRVVRQRVLNLISAGAPDDAALLLFDFLQHSWNGAREPLSTLSDLELLRNKLKGGVRAQKDRWRAEALRHVGRAAEAREYAERARSAFEGINDNANLAHALRLLGHISSELGNSIEGKGYAEQALALFREQGDQLGQAQTEAVLAEIGYLLGDFESSRALAQAGEKHFDSIDQPLGRGQCLLLSSWIEHSEGSVERSRRLALEARAEFERVGYRLGTAQANTSLAHVEHRMLNMRSAEVGAQEALVAFESLRTPRGQAACRRLLAMVGIDIDDPEMATLNAEWSARIYHDLDDPWGIVESKVLLAQVALLKRQVAEAEQLLRDSAATVVEEPEPQQHRLLTQAWLLREQGKEREATQAIERAMRVFPDKRRVGDHTVHLLTRLDRYLWEGEARARLADWRAELRRPANN
ncbi:MAG TPA: tetratricopeptide repeat protein, partial [Polyangiaceae bacterium]|nr:tetratricopeptide repeat protein [Polyangiaceae bacterium]